MVTFGLATVRRVGLSLSSVMQMLPTFWPVSPRWRHRTVHAFLNQLPGGVTAKRSAISKTPSVRVSDAVGSPEYSTSAFWPVPPGAMAWTSRATITSRLELI